MKPSVRKQDKKEEFKPVLKPYRERDMRQEAIDMESHQAKELFGSKDDTPDRRI